MTQRGQICFFVPVFLLFLLFVLLPSTRTLIDSFLHHEAGQSEFSGGMHYRFAMEDPKLHRALANNFGYLLWTLLFEVCVGLWLAVKLERDNRLNRFLRVAFFSPAVLSMVVIGLVFGFLLKDGIGLLPGLLTENRALLTISVISGWAYCGFYMVIFLAGLASIPADVLEAATLEGASGWQAFWRIKLPLMICFTGAFKAFDLFWVLLPNQEHTAILSTLLVQEVIRFDNRGYGSTIAVILTILVCATALVIQAARAAMGQRRSPLP
jgi:ABC-type sugar transport system permease subunit